MFRKRRVGVELGQGDQKTILYPVVYTAHLWDGTTHSWEHDLPKYATQGDGPGHVLMSRKSATYGFTANGRYFPPTSVKEVTWVVQD